MSDLCSMKLVIALAWGSWLTFFLFTPVVKAQSGRPDMTFGNVGPDAFAPATYELDSSANAIFLFDHGEVSFDPTSYTSHGFSVVYERHVRLRILRRSAMGLAALGISAVHRNGYNAVIADIRGATYNLQDGKVVVTALDKSSIFKDKNGSYRIEKIAFPDVREGSVIEYSFRVVYPGFGYIPEWEFQQSYPVLWSEYAVTVPALLDYVVKNQGYRPFTVDTTFYSEAGIRHIWALRNTLPLEKQEPYTTTLRNHVQMVQFQLSAVRFNGDVRTYRTTWPQLTAELLKNDAFGQGIGDRNHWMEEEVRKIGGKKDGSVETASKLFTYVRDRFGCTGQEGLYPSQALKKTWENNRGNVADINLLLTALYRHAGFEASPVILSTRSHGLPIDDLPLLSDYDYVITRVRADNRYYLVDASRSTNGFGQLPEACYNGAAHVLDSSYAVLPLIPDSVTERRSTTIILGNDSASGAWTGTYTRQCGVFESMEMRTRLRKETPEGFFEALRRSMPEYKQMSGGRFDSLAKPEAPLSWQYRMSYHFTQHTVYFDPILHERLMANPLIAPERHYPVEMPYCVDNDYRLRMEVPEGYRIGQLPRSAHYRLEDGSGTFDYEMTATGRTIDFRMRMRLRKTRYPIEQYQGLREFYALVVQKEQEPVIFVKLR